MRSITIQPTREGPYPHAYIALHHRHASAVAPLPAGEVHPPASDSTLLTARGWEQWMLDEESDQGLPTFHAQHHNEDAWAECPRPLTELEVEKIQDDTAAPPMWIELSIATDSEYGFGGDQLGGLLTSTGTRQPSPPCHASPTSTLLTQDAGQLEHDAPPLGQERPQPELPEAPGFLEAAWTPTGEQRGAQGPTGVQRGANDPPPFVDERTHPGTVPRWPPHPERESITKKEKTCQPEHKQRQEHEDAAKTTEHGHRTQRPEREDAAETKEHGQRPPVPCWPPSPETETATAKKRTGQPEHPQRPQLGDAAKMTEHKPRPGR